jgi:hypothetical protein
MTAVPLKPKRSGLTILPVDQVKLDWRAQPRDHVNEDVAAQYGELMREGQWDYARSTGPIVVFFDGADHWLADGFHRLFGAKHAGIAEVLCEVRQGSLRDAQWHSFSANALHGYPRGSKDIERILRRIFEDEEWADRPVRDIAEHTGIKKSTVFKYRDRIVYNANNPIEEPTLSTRGQGSGGRQLLAATRISYVLIEGAEHVGRLTPAEYLEISTWKHADLLAGVRTLRPWLQELEELLDESP